MPKKIPVISETSKGVVPKILEGKGETEAKEEGGAGKVRKTLVISEETNMLFGELFGARAGTLQSDVFENGIRLLWIVKQMLPQDSFRRLVVLLTNGEYEKIMNRLKIEFE